MKLKTHAELYAELKKESHGRLAHMAADFVLQLRDARRQVERLTAALDGLLARHCDGSEEQHWAEWDTVIAARTNGEVEP